MTHKKGDGWTWEEAEDLFADIAAFDKQLLADPRYPDDAKAKIRAHQPRNEALLSWAKSKGELPPSE